MTARSAYRLLDAPGADDFAAAWDAGDRRGLYPHAGRALERALRGDLVPIYRQGKLDGSSIASDRLAIAMLGGQPRYGRLPDRRRLAAAGAADQDFAELDRQQARPRSKRPARTARLLRSNMEAETASADRPAADAPDHASACL